MYQSNEATSHTGSGMVQNTQSLGSWTKTIAEEFDFRLGDGIPESEEKNRVSFYRAISSSRDGDRPVCSPEGTMVEKHSA